MREHGICARLLALGLSAALLLGTLTGCSGGTDDAVVLPQEAGSGEQSGETESTIDPNAAVSSGKKTETVRVKAAADGAAQEITVETVLETQGGGTIADRSNLTNVKNTEGDEQFESIDGVLYWQDLGEDIRYEGTTTQQLPVEVSISSTLDGQSLEPQALAGRSGKVTLRFDYQNHTSETVSVNGSDITVCVPFVAMTAVLLDSEHFSNVEVTNGKAVEMDGEVLVIGYACPGLADSLKLTDYEPTEDAEIPDYVEITADVTDFSLEFTATVLSGGLMEDFDLSDLEDADEMIDDMDELTDASAELADGTSELADGVETFQDYLDEYFSGVNTLKTGVSALDEGIQALNENRTALTDGAAALESGLEQLNTALSQVSLPEGDDLSDPGLAAALTAMGQDAAALGTALEQLETPLGQIETYCAETAEYTAQVNSAAQTALEAVQAVKITDVTDTARQQAADALESALADTELTDGQRADIIAQVQDGIDLGSVNEDAEQQLEAALSALEALAGCAAPSAPDLSGLDLSSVTDPIADMQTQMGALSEGLSQLSDTLSGLSSLEELLEQLQSGISQLYSGSSQLSAGITAFSDGIGQLSDGSSQLAQGCGQLTSAGSELSDGFEELADGVEELADGFAEFDEEGIQELGKLAGDDLAALLDRVRALKAADAGYDNFAGLSEGMTGSVRFLIETEEISADTE